MSHFGPAYLPLEVVEVILDHLHSDGPSLRSSALVQRSWVATTRHHLFDEEVIRQFRSSWADEHPHDNATDFLEICRSPLCTILPAIRSAIVYICDLKADGEVIDVLSHAPKLRKLVYIDCHKDSQASSRRFGNKFPQVKEFVYNPYRNFCEESVKLLASFPGVTTLALNDDENLGGPTAYPQNNSIHADAFTHLRHLHLRLSRPEDMFRWLQSWPSIPLEKLNLCIRCRVHRGWGPVTYLNTFLKSQARTLRHLSLSVEYREGSRRKAIMFKGQGTSQPSSGTQGTAR